MIDKHMSKSASGRFSKPFLVLAHHRSGSNFLCDVLEAHPQVACLNEPFSMHTSVFLPNDLIRWDAVDYRDDVLHPELEGMTTAVDTVKAVARYTGMPGRGFKETLGFEKLRWLEQIFPGRQVILCVRDPRAVVNSVLSRPSMIEMWGYRAVVTRYRDAHGGELPFGISVETPLDLIISSWQIRWFEAQRYIRESRRRPDALPITLVRFEDLMAEPRTALRTVMRAFGLDVHRNQLRFIEESHRGPSRGGAYSTVRDPKQVLTAWQSRLAADSVSRIGSRLRREMGLLGYA